MATTALSSTSGGAQNSPPPLVQLFPLDAFAATVLELKLVKDKKVVPLDQVESTVRFYRKKIDSNLSFLVDSSAHPRDRLVLKLRYLYTVLIDFFMEKRLAILSCGFKVSRRSAFTDFRAFSPDIAPRVHRVCFKFVTLQEKKDFDGML